MPTKRNRPDYIKNDLGNSVVKYVKHPCRLLLIGRSTLGKTTLAVDLAMKQIIPNVTRCFAVCPSWYLQDTFKPLRDIKGAFPRKHVFLDVEDGVFEFIEQICTNYPGPTLLFLDDAAADKATHGGRKTALGKLCFNAPHLKLTIIGCFQQITTVTPSFRDNAEILVSFMPSGEDDVEHIVKEFNPCPSRLDSKKITRLALTQAWQLERFVFIMRERYNPSTCPLPRTRFFAGLTREIVF